MRLAALLIIVFSMSGCTASVESTEDSNRVTVETPKLETSGQQPDMDPTTDDDVDIDTPLPGDR